jgi:acetyltransferase-like isoleucine patch superfamily enzyme
MMANILYFASSQIKNMISMFLFEHMNNSYRVRIWKKMGVKMGNNCRISCLSLSSESYLIELGDNVIIAKNSKLITHEGSVCIFHHENPHLDLFGRIKIGSNTFIGMNCIILPKTTIGSNCVIGAGSVVRGNIPDNSIVIGNPAQVIMSTEQYRKKVYSNPVLFEYRRLNSAEKKKILLERISDQRGKDISTT